MPRAQLALTLARLFNDAMMRTRTDLRMWCESCIPSGFPKS